MHQLTFFPLGNADCIRIDLASGKQLLFDYAAMRNPDDASDLRIDLAAELKGDLRARGRNAFDVVAFTHLDDDHIHGAAEFFELDWAAKYQGAGRIKMKELWVPAAAIIEPDVEDDARALRQEARHRLRKGYGIRVFSRPERLKKWFEAEGLTIESRQHLITDAGKIVPGFDGEGVEFFVHSPFAVRQDDNSVVDRNGDALVLHATFVVDGVETKVLLTSDITYDEISALVKMTKKRKNEHRLAWDVVDVPHHCSYRGLGPEKGKDKTVPEPEIKWLYEQGRGSGLIISPSWPIPAGDEDQPPHRQAAAYYQERAVAIGGEFKVTMEHPSRAAPKPLVVTIDRFGSTVKRAITGGAPAIISRPAPRAG